MIPRATVLIIAWTSLLAACSNSERLGMGGGTQNSPQVTPAVTAPQPAPPPVNLAGRWTLSSAGSGSCAMTFGANPEATEGTIAPGGGCPFSFFTSRKWNYTLAGLTIRDHNAQALAQLTPAGPDRFEGKANSGQDLTLSR